MSEAVSKNSNEVLRVSVFSDGNPVKTSLFPLVSVFIYKGVNKIGKAILLFEAGDMPNEEFEQSDKAFFEPGKIVRVEAGYGQEENPIFEGAVSTHKVIIEPNNQSFLEIECRDFAFSTTFIRKNKIFQKKTDSEAIKDILGTYADLSCTVDSTSTKYNELVQYYSTDWDFVLSRADANGLVIVTENKDIKIQKPDVSASPKLKVTYGIDMIEFEGELMAADQQAGISAVAWDQSKQDIMTADAKKPSLNNQGKDKPEKLATALGSDGNYILQTSLCPDKSALQAWADGQRLKAGLSRIQGHCKFIGNAKAMHGELIELKGVGSRFEGDAYIGYVEHTIKNGLWTTTVGLGLPMENITENPEVSASPALGFLPGIQGLQIGKITKLDEDPTGENKIQVELPVLNSENNTVWARLSNFWSSNAYGAFFVPDVNDEVVVGFFDNDPCQAVILGSLYSSKQKPPYEITKENELRGFLTKSKMKIEFNEKDKIISIETPNKNTILLSDKDKGIQITDENKNKIIMDQSGIVIQSEKEITLKSKTNMLLDSGANLDEKAKSNVSLKGVNIEAAANANMTVKGTAKAEFSASGQTVVKGAMVMIN